MKYKDYTLKYNKGTLRIYDENNKLIQTMMSLLTHPDSPAVKIDLVEKAVDWLDRETRVESINKVLRGLNDE